MAGADESGVDGLRAPELERDERTGRWHQHRARPTAGRAVRLLRIVGASILSVPVRATCDRAFEEVHWALHDAACREGATFSWWWTATGAHIEVTRVVRGVQNGQCSLRLTAELQRSSPCELQGRIEPNTMARLLTAVPAVFAVAGVAALVGATMALVTGSDEPWTFLYVWGILATVAACVWVTAHRRTQRALLRVVSIALGRND